MCRVAMISLHTCPLARPGYGDAGGMNVYVRELSRELGRRGMTIDVFTRWTDPRLPQVVRFAEQARVIHLKAGEVAPRPKNQLFPHLPEFLYNLVHFKEQHRLDYRFLHTHYWLSGWVGGLLRQRWKVSHVAMFHTLGEVKKRARPGEQESVQRLAVERKLATSADAIIAASRHERAQLLSLYGAHPQKVTVIPCGVDLDLFAPQDKAEAKRKLGLANKWVLLFVGRLEPLKGLDLLLRALTLLPHEHNFHLLVVGGQRGDAERQRLKSLAQQLGLGHQVSFREAVDHTRLPLYYNAADVCVVPSHYESFGLATLEALACGTPVVASKVGGLQSTICDGENGFLIPWRCPEAWAEKIALLMTDRAAWSRLAAAARPSAERFPWAFVTERVLEVYQALGAAHTPYQSCPCGAAL